MNEKLYEEKPKEEPKKETKEEAKEESKEEVPTMDRYAKAKKYFYQEPTEDGVYAPEQPAYDEKPKEYKPIEKNKYGKKKCPPKHKKMQKYAAEPSYQQPAEPANEYSTYPAYSKPRNKVNKYKAPAYEKSVEQKEEYKAPVYPKQDEYSAPSYSKPNKNVKSYQAPEYKKPADEYKPDGYQAPAEKSEESEKYYDSKEKPKYDQYKKEKSTKGYGSDDKEVKLLKEIKQISSQNLLINYMILESLGTGVIY